MTPLEVRERARHIAETSRDLGKARESRDRLLLDVLRAIANGSPNAQALAVEALVMP